MDVTVNLLPAFSQMPVCTRRLIWLISKPNTTVHRILPCSVKRSAFWPFQVTPYLHKPPRRRLSTLSLDADVRFVQTDPAKSTSFIDITPAWNIIKNTT